MAVVLVAVLGVVAIADGWLATSAPGSSYPAGRCRAPVGAPVAVAVSGRANSPRFADSRVLESFLLGATASRYAVPPLILVNVDGAPRVVGDAGEAPDPAAAQAHWAEETRDFVASFAGRVSDVRAAHAEVDVLTALDTAARAVHATSAQGVVVLIDSGLSTTGPVDFTVPGMTYAEPRDIADFLQKNDLLPDFHGITVVMVGVGEVAPPQQALLPGHRNRLTGIWTEVLGKAGAACVSVIDQPRRADAPSGVPSVTTVTMPEAPAFSPPPIGVPGEELVLRNDASTGFAPDTATLLDPAAARRVLTPVATWLAGDPARRVTITGTTDDVGDERAQVLLSQRRADTIASVLEDLGAAAAQLEAVGVGSDFAGYVTDTGPSGEILPAEAGANRTIRIRFSGG